MKDRLVCKFHVSGCPLGGVGWTTRHQVKLLSVMSKLLLGAVLGAGSVIATAQSFEVEDEYQMGLAMTEEYRYGLALQHFQQAAQQGHREAQNITGLMLLYGPRLFGDEIQTDLLQSKYWLKQAATQGAEISIHMLRKMDNSGALKKPTMAGQP